MDPAGAKRCRLELEQINKEIHILRCALSQQLLDVHQLQVSEVVSVSSCEYELHSLTSCACDSLSIKGCAVFVLDGQIEHVIYTDSSSARQLASRQGSGQVRHLSRKVLWIQEKTADGDIDLRQVPTAFNVADLGTKVLSRQRLFYLLHEIGLVYITDYSTVGADEFAMQQEKHLSFSTVEEDQQSYLEDEHSYGF